MFNLGDLEIDGSTQQITESKNPRCMHCGEICEEVRHMVIPEINIKKKTMVIELTTPTI
jgi:hypothetical protein